jgi:hypothetical protein
MYGIYLKCESCGKTIGGEEVTPRHRGAPTLGRFDGAKLRALAADRGWTHEEPDSDFCPACSAARLSAVRSAEVK